MNDLRGLNLEIPDRENEGDVAFFEGLLTKAFAMRRKDGVVDRADYLASLKKGGQRRAGPILSVSLLGERQALVTCLVHDGDRSYENTRLFIRDERAAERWLLLAWANEEIRLVESTATRSPAE